MLHTYGVSSILTVATYKTIQMTKKQRYKQYIIDFLERKVKFIKTVPDFPSEYLQTFEDLLFSAISTADDDVLGLESIVTKRESTLAS